MRPRRNVPAVSTTARARKLRPSAVTTPDTRAPSVSRRVTIPWVSSMSGNPSSSDRTARRYSVRSHWARGAQTAGPLERLSIRNWIVARSVARPMMPPSASISRTTVPFAIPPMAGLQDKAPMVSRFEVRRRTFAPDRAAMTDASVPACPAPTTIRSYSYDMREKLVPQDAQKLDAQTHRGKQSTGFRPIRCLADLPEQTEQGLARLRGECFEAPELGGLEVADVARNGQRRLDLCQ